MLYIILFYTIINYVFLQGCNYKMATIKELLKEIPSYAKDIESNLIDFFTKEQNILTPVQFYGVALAICYKLKHDLLLNTMKIEAKIFMDEINIDACKNAAIMMDMTNTYHIFSQEMSIKECKDEAMKLNIQTIISPLINPIDFYMYCLAISVLNGCGYCIDVFANKLLEKDIKHEVIPYIARMASILKATKSALKINSIQSHDFIFRSDTL